MVDELVCQRYAMSLLTALDNAGLIVNCFIYYFLFLISANSIRS